MATFAHRGDIKITYFAEDGSPTTQYFPWHKVNWRDTNNVVDGRLVFRFGRFVSSRFGITNAVAIRKSLGANTGYGTRGLALPDKKYVSISPTTDCSPSEYTFAESVAQIAALTGRADTKAYERFYRGRHGLHTGNAALGVSLGSFRQSYEMIAKRSMSVHDTLRRVEVGLQKNPKKVAALRRRYQLKEELIADDILEYQFGWIPLLEDISNSFHVLSKDVSAKPHYHSARGGVTHEWTGMVPTGVQATREVWLKSSVSSTMSAVIRVDNPNLWLANQLGLVNPFVVAYDLVPWSFVAGMFVNVNSLLLSLTDEVGLSILDECVTRTGRALVTDDWNDTRMSKGKYPYSHVKVWKTYYSKVRETRTSLKPSVQYKIPKSSLDLAVTASSLVVQRFRNINRLLKIPFS